MTKLPDAGYIEFITDTISSYENFKPLKKFMNNKAPGEASITVIEFSAHEKPTDKEIIETELRAVLDRKTANQIFIVENLTPNVLALLGGYCKVKDPQFFLDYLDISIETSSKKSEKPWYNSETIKRYLSRQFANQGQSDQEESNQNRPNSPQNTPTPTKRPWYNSKTIKETLSQHISTQNKPKNPLTATKPWYNLKHIEEHLPRLFSLQKQSNYVVFHFISPREYRPDDDDACPIKIKERLEPDGMRTRIHRIAGGYNPIQSEDSKHHAIAMTRNYAAVWFDEKPGGGWTRGIILLDPPFKPFEEIGGTGRVPKYRSFKPRLSFKEPYIPLAKPSTPPVEQRATYRKALSECMVSNALLENVDDPAQFLVLQDLFRLITSEWLCVNMYVERDLNTIEWRLEDNKMPVSFHDFEMFLSSLFKLRRRINKYSALVEEQLQFCNIRKPESWNTSFVVMASSSITSSRTSDTFDGIQKDLSQVQEAIQRNRDRIAQSVGLLTSLMSVLEGKQSVTQNRRLAFLTILATLLLPFNTMAAILGMSTKYGAGGPMFGMFFRISGGVVGLAILMLVLLYAGPVLVERRRRLEMM